MRDGTKLISYSDNDFINSIYKLIVENRWNFLNMLVLRVNESDQYITKLLQQTSAGIWILTDASLSTMLCWC